MAIAMIRCDDSQYVNNLLRHDICEPLHTAQTAYNMAGKWHRRLLLYRAGVNRDFITDPYPITSGDLRRLYANVAAFRAEFQSRWIESGIDALVLPACGSVAMTPETVMTVSQTLLQKSQCTSPFLYTMLFNVLDYPAGVVPWTSVTSHDVSDCRSADHIDEREHNRVYAENCLDSSVGLPVAVHVATPPFREEMTMHVMKILAGHSQ